MSGDYQDETTAYWSNLKCSATTSSPTNWALEQNEISLQTATEQLEFSVRQQRLALFEAPESNAKLRGRAVAIGEQMTAAAARINASKTTHQSRLIKTCH